MNYFDTKPKYLGSHEHLSSIESKRVNKMFNNVNVRPQFCRHEYVFVCMLSSVVMTSNAFKSDHNLLFFLITN